LLVGSGQLPLEALIFALELCGLFRHEILVPLQKMLSMGGFMPSFLSYVEAILRPAQIQLSGVYDPNFFFAAFLHAFLSVETWMVSDYMLPEHVPPATFHVYKLISCLQKFPLLLPMTGLSLLEAKHIGILANLLSIRNDGLVGQWNV
jgi:esterase/lipase superfamily enzyme